MFYLVLRITTNLIILFGLLLIVFGFGGAIGKTIFDFSEASSRQKPESVSQIRPQISSLQQFPNPINPAATQPLPVQATNPTSEENGFIPYRIPIPASGEPFGDENPAAANELALDEPAVSPEPPAIPDRIVIPQVGLDAPVVLSPIEWVQMDGITYQQWEAPMSFAAGWQEGSAMPGQDGNFILIGHHNIYDNVFGHLVDLKEGDAIAIFSGQRLFGYYVSQVVLLEERDTSLIKRQENAMWIRPTADERLTLVTCWPPESNTHRLIIIAQPAK